VVAVFQWGWGKDLAGLAETVPIVSWVPLMMFAILFGLSMDYEVFLISSIREAHRRTGDTAQAVADGLASTARVITAAAVIMMAVFGAFVAHPDPVVKMVGLGLAVAVLVDATLIRMVLVPGTMVLLGRANWWLPRWLDRILPTIDIEGEATPAVVRVAVRAAGTVSSAPIQQRLEPDHLRGGVALQPPPEQRFREPAPRALEAVGLSMGHERAVGGDLAVEAALEVVEEPARRPGDR
jgi:putative drug exporter of the RND superfamily